MGLRKGLRLVRGMRRSLTEDEQHKIAGAIVEHLEGRAGADARGTWSAPHVQVKGRSPSRGPPLVPSVWRSSRHHLVGAPRSRTSRDGARQRSPGARLWVQGTKSKASILANLPAIPKSRLKNALSIQSVYYSVGSPHGDQFPVREMWRALLPKD
jgi:hypothetical protein